MKIGFIGLGRMGLNMVTRLVLGGHSIHCTARTSEKRADAERIRAVWAESPAAMIENLSRTDDPGRQSGKADTPRIVWIMVPAGETTQTVIDEVASSLSPGDLIVDGGNSDYRDSKRRGTALAAKGLRFIDCGTSGGIWGLEKGYCLMIGGAEADVRCLAPIFTTLAPPQGWEHVGPVSAGHYVKMVHNAIEYGMMQAFAEGFALLEEQGDDLDLHRISKLWNHGSVVRSWLLELAERAFAEDPHLEALAGHVDDSGEGRWAVETAIGKGVPAPVIAASVFARFSSRRPDAFENRFLAALRNQFGGHPVRKSSR
ncbi:MAG: decarboxylating 6-phosphogluconate dehydrogenase [Candidatus Riflebacteria bacterium]|nr:decarboxylating 6-phosphogluconate dehydrogenase [Candidatus Riflebacteria bacterium]